MIIDRRSLSGDAAEVLTRGLTRVRAIAGALHAATVNAGIVVHADCPGDKLTAPSIGGAARHVAAATARVRVPLRAPSSALQHLLARRATSCFCLPPTVT